MAARRPRTASAPTRPARPAARDVRGAAPRPQPTLVEQRDRILGHLRGLHASHLMAFGLDTGSFQQLAHAGPHGLNATELADRTGWDADYTRVFLEAALALGLLELASEAGVTPRSRYRLAPFVAALLTDETSPDWIGEAPRLHVLASLDYRRFPDLYRSGKTYPYALHGEAFLRSAAAVTRTLPDRFLREHIPRLPRMRRALEAGAHVLDVGCGAGWTLVRLAEEFPKCRVVGVDAEPNAIEMAKTLVVMRQLSSRAEARLVRGEELDYEAEFDVATFFLVLHTIPPANRATALAHARRALKHDGLLLVVDEAYPGTPEEFRDPERSLTALAQWTEAPWGHRYATRRETLDLLEASGFRAVEDLMIGRHHVVLAEKA